MMQVDDPKAVVSAIKGEESGKGIVIRLWNIGSEPISPKISTMFEIVSASVADMSEKPRKSLKHGKHHVKLPRISPREITTILLEAKPLEPPVKSSEITWPTCSNGYRTY